jgi:hypothetical protein
MKQFPVILLVITMAGPANAACQKDGDGRKGEIETTTCFGPHGGRVGVSVPPSQVDHFIRYPLGQSDHSVPKDIGHGAEHVAKEVAKILHW